MFHSIRLYTSLLSAAFIAFSCVPSGNDAGSRADASANLAQSQDQTDQNGSVRLLSVDDFESLLIEERADVQLLDVRTSQECSGGVIAGASHANIADKSGFESEILQLDKQLPVMVYCAVGGRSKVAAGILADRGFRQVYDLRGGYNAWSSANKKTITPNGDF